MDRLLINIDVPNVERGVAFYTQAFDLKVGRRLGADFVELLGAAVPIYLLQNNAGTAPYEHATTRRSYERHWSPVHLDFVVSDLNAALDRALTAGAIQEQAPSTHAYGRLVQLADPFGHGVCLLEFNARGYDVLAAASGW